MKITDIKFLQVSGTGEFPQDSGRGVDALDLYPEFGDAAWVESIPGSGARRIECLYLQIRTDVGIEGLHGPVMPEQLDVINRVFRKFLIGRDPLPANLLWDQMFRLERHARTGLVTMGLSALDNALWDIRGKHHGVPVYKLLGGPVVEKIPVYASSYPDLDLERVASRVRKLKDQGFRHQKWFFRFGPADGRRGIEQNAGLAAVVREAAGPETEIMFDGRRAWDVPFTLDVLREIESLRIHWLEEPLPANDLDGHRQLRKRSRVPIATGEHLYTRWEAKPYCQEFLVDYLQCDPEWCGGLTELMKIIHMAEANSIKVVPHGRHIAAAVHAVASMPPSVCPLLETIVEGHLPYMQFFNRLRLVPKNGYLELPQHPGLGLDLDMNRVEKIVEIA